MHFDWWTFIFQVVNVLVLLWLLNRFLFGPVARIVAERKAETDKIMQAAEAAKQAAAEAETAAKAERERLAAERADLLEKARHDAEAQRQSLLAKARQDAQAVIDAAKAESAQAQEEDRRQRTQRAADLSVSITGRLLANLPDGSRIAGYPERLAAAIAALDDEQKKAIVGEAGSLHVVAPRPLSDAELSAVRDAIGGLVPLDGPLRVEVDPSLIAGLELRGRHGAIRNSLGADLQRISEALANDDRS